MYSSKRQARHEILLSNGSDSPPSVKDFGLAGHIARVNEPCLRRDVGRRWNDSNQRVWSGKVPEQSAQWPDKPIFGRSTDRISPNYGMPDEEDADFGLIKPALETGHPFCGQFLHWKHLRWPTPSELMVWQT